jgi:hypothetical protein
MESVMPKSAKSRPAAPARTKQSPDMVTVKAVEKDLGAILRRAAQGPVRIAAKAGGQRFHIATIRTGAAGAASLPVAAAALERRAGRILHLASALQIALRVQAVKSGPLFYIEPGSQCFEFAAQRLGSASGEVAALKNVLRHSRIAVAAADAAGKQGASERQDEADGLRRRIATLERAAKKHAALAEEAAASRDTLKEARAAQSTAETQRRDEVKSLKSRITTLERSLKEQTALVEDQKRRLAAWESPDQEILASTPPLGRS